MSWFVESFILRAPDNFVQLAIGKIAKVKSLNLANKNGDVPYLSISILVYRRVVKMFQA